jgi:transmembrane sensor
MSGHEPVDETLDEEAADWLVRLTDPDAAPDEAACSDEFFAWLSRSPRHVSTFLEVSETFRGLDGLDSQHRIDVKELMARRGADVVVLRASDGNGSASTSARHGSPRPRRAWFAAAAAMLAVVVGLLWNQSHRTLLETTVGEQRIFKLDDGSMLYLNTRSRVQPHFSEQRREIQLLSGEGLFSVKSDPSRPFVVSTRDGTIQALGTQFNVYEHDDATIVSVIEGVVLVTAENNSMQLTAGHEARIAAGKVVATPGRDVADAVAWNQRRLVFREAPLIEVAAEFNRYNRTSIRLEDERVRELRLTGVFSADHPQSVILYLRKDESLVVEQFDDEWHVRSR